MRKTILLVVVLIVAMTCGWVYAKDYEMTKKAGDLTVLIAIDKNPPVTGKNKLTVTIKDTAGKAITGAAVAIDYGMPAMPGMGAMNYKTAAVLKGQSYAATLDFSMPGPWFINIKINQGGNAQTVKLNVDIK